MCLNSVALLGVLFLFITKAGVGSFGNAAGAN